PRFARTPFSRWFERRASRNPQGAEVLLFPDTFNKFFEPDVAIAATGVLERAGFHVTLPPRDVCCGRPLYDQGMLDRARIRMLDVFETLAPYAERGVTIVGLEPSCILPFRDELPALLPRLSRARTLADN